MRLTKYDDVTGIHQKEAVQLRDGQENGQALIEWEIQALPPDYDDTAEAELPTPRPKRLGIETSGPKDRPVLDPNSGRPLVKYNDTDPGYLKELRETNKLQAVKMLLDGSVAGQIVFEAQFDPADPKAYYRAVLLELKEFGFSMGDLLMLVKRIGALSGIGEDEVKSAEAVFSKAES